LKIRGNQGCRDFCMLEDPSWADFNNCINRVNPHTCTCTHAFTQRKDYFIMKQQSSSSALQIMDKRGTATSWDKTAITIISSADKKQERNYYITFCLQLKNKCVMLNFVRVY